jgi:putative methyltransferase (TIGR04325 family)
MSGSTARQLLHDFVPPVLARCWRRIRRRPEPTPPARHTWEGVYPHVREVPRVGGGYNEEDLVADTLHQTRQVIEVERGDASLPLQNTPEHSLLALLCAVVGWQRGSVSVLDFGGGAGVDYVYLRQALARGPGVEYHVVELPALCARAPELYPDDRRIHFHAALPEGAGSFDVIHLSSSLQYVEDYAGLIARLCRYAPRFLLFTTLSAGDFPTFASAQKNLDGTVLPYWFLNLREVISLCETNGLALIFKGVMGREYDQANFPEPYRVGRTCNLLFARHEPIV